jgi:hypothetical protein
MKTASAAATESATTRRVIVAQRPGIVLGQGVAVALAVGGAHERRDDVEVPLADLRRLAPQVGQAQVDVQLEEVDP